MDFSLDNGEIAGDVFKSVIDQHPRLRDHKLLFSINQEFASGDEMVRDGDELAIFTAVSGG
jgi:molybdopterin converting factor small subunit